MRPDVVHLSAKGAFLDPLLGKVEFTLSDSGAVVRSVDHGIDLPTTITGTMEQTSEVSNPDGPRRVTLTGSVSLEESVAVTRAAGGGIDPKWSVSEADLRRLHAAAPAKTRVELELAARSAPKAPPPGKILVPK